jgi:hypothetical protein
MWLKIPPTLSASAEKEESSRKVCGSRSRQLLHQLKKKNPEENYVAPDPTISVEMISLHYHLSCRTFQTASLIHVIHI